MIKALDAVFVAAAQKAGLPTDPFKIIVCLLLSYPLAGILKRIPDRQPNLKNAFVIVTGLFFLLGVFDMWVGVRTLSISSLGTYLLSKYFRNPMMPWVNFVFVIGHLSIKYVIPLLSFVQLMC